VGATHGQVDGLHLWADGGDPPSGGIIPYRGDGKIRQKLLKMDLIEAVIWLAPDLFYGT
jgi:hypothetical protein